MVLSTCKMWSNGIKIDLFSKKSPSDWGLRPPSSSDPRPWYVWVELVYLHTSTNLDSFFFNFWFKHFPFRKLLVKCQTTPRLLIFHSTISLSHKSSSFENLWWRHCMWFLVWGPPIKNPGYAYAGGRGHFGPCPPPKSLLVSPRRE